jgi:hypothetical protein
MISLSFPFITGGNGYGTAMAILCALQCISSLRHGKEIEEEVTLHFKNIPSIIETETEFDIFFHLSPLL